MLKNICKAIKIKIIYKAYLIISRIIERGKIIDEKKVGGSTSEMIMDISSKTYPTINIMNMSHNPALIRVGKNSIIAGELLVFEDTGEIKIGDHCYVGVGTRIWSANSIEIGDRVLISHNVNIHDTNSHPINITFRHEHFKENFQGHLRGGVFNITSSSILIEDDVWIGFNSAILKGVRIGRGSIVAACSVVTKDVPEFVMVAGNPARVIKNINDQLETAS